MIFHGTDARFLDDILRNGIRPWDEFRESTNWSQIPTKPGLVYLSEVYGLYYAQGAGDETSDMALIEIDDSRLEQDNILPDEDFIAQLFWEAKAFGEAIPLELSEVDNLADLTAKIDPIAYQTMITSCRIHFGNVAYLGTISPDAIGRYATVPYNNDNMVLHALSSDPALSVLNTLLVGDRYRSLCEFVINGKRHPLADLTVKEYLALPTLIVKTPTPDLYDRIDGLTRARLCEERGVQENKQVVSDDMMLKYRELLRKLSHRATALYERQRLH